MSFFRLTLVLLALGLAESSCSCGRAPVTNTLKAEGEACANDEECESSLCDKLPGKALVCFRKCATVCKAGDICSALANNDRFACVPEKPGLCQGCALNVDCPYPGDRCLEIGGTKVCSRDCSFDGQCPSSYRCADGTDTNGAFVTKQCQPTSGTCECTAASAGQTTPCQEANAFGTCNGVRTCRPPNGYEACTAPVPTSESCNGRDDDCNGMSDENLGETTCGTGECRRTVSNCINGSPQTCEALPRGTEVCDEKDNNCDGVVDDGFDKMTSLTNCGTCNTPCIRPHATPVCLGGMCGIGACLPGFVNADGIDLNGCELMCTPTGVEICDGLDNDCNGVVDDGFSTVSDLNNCGQCGRVCNVNNGHIATYACLASACGITTCSAGYADCDQAYANGCELSVSANVTNCGACNNACTTPNATPACVTSACAIGSCNSGYTNCDGLVPNGCEIQTSSDVDHCGTCPNVCPAIAHAARTCVGGGCGYSCTAPFLDLDGDPLNGCEFSCTPTGADDPDDSSTDQNCDGIDGDVARGLFVAVDGNNSNPGTRALPKATVQAAINAGSTTQPHVYVSAGTYDEAITLRAGISVYGGYSRANNWARGPAYVVTLRNGVPLNGRIVAVEGATITTATTVAYVTIQARDTVVAGVSTYGLHCTGCTGLTLRNSLVIGGSAGSGAAGTAGTRGADGFAGSGGTDGTCNTNIDGAPGGAGGASLCARTGGAGGRGGNYGDNPGLSGGTGIVGTPGGAGGSGGDPGRAGAVGTDGAIGTSGPNGGKGSGATVIGSYFVANPGSAGNLGGDGNGGGGGGGGGGQGCTLCNDANGNGGGGGGGAGCAGTGALGGGGGGSSFGVFLVDSTGAVMTSNTISSGNGGTGGTGGTGGQGGTGGTRGVGATYCTGEIGAGGNGGKGGDGGRGGHGGGGAGGASYAVYRLNSPVSTTGNMLSAGNGGPGGTSLGSAGDPGAANTVFP